MKFKSPQDGRRNRHMTRPDKINYYLDIAETVSKRSTCLRKHYGAIIVKKRYNNIDGLQRCAARTEELFGYRLLHEG